MSPDPTLLNVLKTVNPRRWNLYQYALNNPLANIDPDGEETIAVFYPGYQVAIRGKHTLPLGHAGVVVVDKDGSTHYFEYGRYNGPVGETRNAGADNVATTPLQRDDSGNFTLDSMKALLSTSISPKGSAKFVQESSARGVRRGSRDTSHSGVCRLKALKRNNGECKGILIGPVMDPRFFRAREIPFPCFSHPLP